jgi:hypothetical protein
MVKTKSEIMKKIIVSFSKYFVVFSTKKSIIGYKVQAQILYFIRIFVN